MVVPPPLGATGLLLSHVFIMLMNVKMPTIVGIQTFVCILNVQLMCVYVHDKCSVEFSI